MSGQSFHTPGHPVVPGMDFTPTSAGWTGCKTRNSGRAQSPQSMINPALPKAPIFRLLPPSTMRRRLSSVNLQSTRRPHRLQPIRAKQPFSTLPRKAQFDGCVPGRDRSAGLSPVWANHPPGSRPSWHQSAERGHDRAQRPGRARAPIDPRLGGLDQLGISELDTFANPAQLLWRSHRAAGRARSQCSRGRPSASSSRFRRPSAAAAADPELAARMQRMEAMMIELSQQLAHMREQDAKARAGTPAVVQAAPAAAGAPHQSSASAPVPAPAPTASEPHTARPATSAPRVMVKAQPARAATSRPAVNQKAAASKAVPAENQRRLRSPAS